MKEMTYGDLEYGDEFKISPDGKRVVYDVYGHRTLDRRWFRKTNDGSLEIIDCFGNPCEAQNYRIYCYLTMPVYVREDDDG